MRVLVSVLALALFVGVATAATPTCSSMCALLEKACVGSNVPFASTNCVTECGSVSGMTPGSLVDYNKNTMGCRMLYASAAISDPSSAKHLCFLARLQNSYTCRTGAPLAVNVAQIQPLTQAQTSGTLTPTPTSTTSSNTAAVTGAVSCTSLCALYNTACTGTDKPYLTANCVAECQTVPGMVTGTASEFNKNSVGCRMLYAQAAQLSVSTRKLNCYYARLPQSNSCRNGAVIAVNPANILPISATPTTTTTAPVPGGQANQSGQQSASLATDKTFWEKYTALIVIMSVLVFLTCLVLGYLMCCSGPSSQPYSAWGGGGNYYGNSQFDTYSSNPVSYGY